VLNVSISNKILVLNAKKYYFIFSFSSTQIIVHYLVNRNWPWLQVYPLLPNKKSIYCYTRNSHIFWWILQTSFWYVVKQI